VGGLGDLRQRHLEGNPDCCRDGGVADLAEMSVVSSHQYLYQKMYARHEKGWGELEEQYATSSPCWKAPVVMEEWIEL